MSFRQKVVDVCAYVRRQNGILVNVCKHKRSMPH